jgi:lactate dehydrogenase-like 2-hydroxyacid dehydrogenase
MRDLSASVNMTLTSANLTKIVTPHVAGASRGSVARMVTFCSQNIKDVWEGKALRAVVTIA